MKLRNGFVSNSSSSSFCIVGTEISSLKDLENAKKNKSKISIIGTYLYEGQDVFEVKDFYTLLHDNFDTISKNVTIVEESSNEQIASVYEDRAELDLSKIPAKLKNKKITVFFGQADYHETDNKEDFVERYILGDSY